MSGLTDRRHFATLVSLRHKGHSFLVPENALLRQKSVASPRKIVKSILEPRLRNNSYLVIRVFFWRSDALKRFFLGGGDVLTR